MAVLMKAKTEIKYYSVSQPVMALESLVKISDLFFF